MRALFTNNWIDIGAGQAVSGIADQSHTLRIASGRVWVTVEGDIADYWLKAGDTFNVAAGRLLVVEADAQTSRVYLAPQHTPRLQLGAHIKRSVQGLLHSKSGAKTACAAQ